MNVAVSKWGNSLGIRVPTMIVESMDIHPGDSLTCEMRDDEMVFRKKRTTAQMFEDFYKKPYDEITMEDIGFGSELDWGGDVGGEVY